MPRAAELVARYGYLAIFCLLMLGIVGPLIPDETILVLAGILARQGHLDYVAVLAAGYAGSLCGITMSYIIGRKGLLYLIQKMPFFRKHSAVYMGRVETWFGRYGHWTLFFGYFVVGVRHFTAVVAGASKMEGAPLRRLRLRRRPDLGGLLRQPRLFSGRRVGAGGPHIKSRRGSRYPGHRGRRGHLGVVETPFVAKSSG